MKYKNIKNAFKDPYLGRIVKQDEQIELERELLGIEKRYLRPLEEKSEVTTAQKDSGADEEDE